MRIRRSLVDNGGVRNVTVKRLNILADLLQVYNDPNITDFELRVRFEDEVGFDGGGLTRELFPVFWKAVEDEIMTPEINFTYYCLGKILSHGYILTGFLPLNLSGLFLASLLSTDFIATNDVLEKEFLMFIDDFEREAAEECLAGGEETSQVFNDIIMPMVGRFRYRKVPNRETLKEVLVSLARYSLVCLPHYGLTEMRKGMEAAHGEFWGRVAGSLPMELFEMLSPTTEKVLAMVIEPEFSRSAEEETFDYLRRFIYQLSPERLGKFLQFATGTPQCALQNISVTFNSTKDSFARRPVASTCIMMLNLPTSYHSFTSFLTEFQGVLDNSHMWSFDAI